MCVNVRYVVRAIVPSLLALLLTGIEPSRAQPAEISLLGTWSGWHTEAVTLEGNRAFAGADSALAILDISDPSNPIEMGRIEIGLRPRDIAVANHYAYVVDHRGRFHVVNVSNPEEPKIVRSFGDDFWYPGHHVMLMDTVVFATRMAGGNGYVRAFDVSHPAHPVEIGDVANQAYDLVVRNDEYYFFTMGAGTYMWDVQSLDPIEKESKGTVDFEPVKSAQLVGSFVFAVGEAFRVLELSGPFEVEEVSRLSVDGENLIVANDLAYVAGSQGGLRVIDVSARADPNTVASYSTPYHAYDVGVQGSIVAVADSDPAVSGEGSVLFLEYNFEKGTVSTEDSPHLAPDALEAVYPNPSRGEIRIMYQIEEAAPVRFEIFDLLGRRVESIEQDMQPAGRYELTWHAVGMSSGTYVVQLTRGDVTESRIVQVIGSE